MVCLSFLSICFRLIVTKLGESIDSQKKLEDNIVMDPPGNNDFRILFRWKELAVSLNLTVKESKQGELFIHEMDTTEGKNWVPFQRRDLVRIKILKKNASLGRTDKQTGPVINESIENATFSTIPGLPVYRWLYFSTSNAIRNFFPYLQFRENYFRGAFTADFHRKYAHRPLSWAMKNPHHRTYHFIEQNILDWNRKAGVMSCRTTARFNRSQKITNRPRSFDRGTLLLSNEKNTLKFRIKVT